MDRKIDIVFSFDTTGSMYPCLAEVRRRVKEVVGRLFKEIPSIRIGIIAHGDYCDKNHPYIMTGLDLSKNLADVQKFVAQVKPTCGGDWSECYELVLHHVQSLDWRADADSKILVMIGDATPHRKGYRYGSEVAKYDWKEECKALKKQDIVVYAVQAMAGRNRRSEERKFYETCARLTDGVKIDLQQLSNIIQLVMAIGFQQAGPEQFQAYEDELKTSGKLNRNIAAMLDTLAGRKRSAYTFTASTSLDPVDPARFQVVDVDHDCGIKAFVVDEMGANFKVGRGFYEFTKREEVQERKEVILVDPSSGDMWTGSEAREMIGIPYGSRGKVSPRDLKWDVFIQSTSWNRKLKSGTRFLYEVADWEASSRKPLA
jgi:hypothetical protein